MSSIDINAYAKINLCLDVKGIMEGGYHEVAMVMQQIALHDVVSIDWQEIPAAEAGGISISLSSDREDLPDDPGNLAWRAAEEMCRTYGGDRRGEIGIKIEKNIPMAAGLAGGSSDCAAVIHGLNVLWDLGLGVKELCTVGAVLGSDVPFCIMAQAAADPALKIRFERDPNACHCAIATGRGTELEPIEGLKSYLVLSKPDISVSTGEAYEGIDHIEIAERPDIEAMRRAIADDDCILLEKNMVNVLEIFTLKRYPVVVYTKDKMQKSCDGAVLMSGSGPTVYCLCKSKEEAMDLCREMKSINEESYCSETTY